MNDRYSILRSRVELGVMPENEMRYNSLLAKPRIGRISRAAFSINR